MFKFGFLTNEQVGELREPEEAQKLENLKVQGLQFQETVRGQGGEELHVRRLHFDGLQTQKRGRNNQLFVLRKTIEIDDQKEAIEFLAKVNLLKELSDDKNIFLDFSAEGGGGFFRKKKYIFKIYYKYESGC